MCCQQQGDKISLVPSSSIPMIQWFQDNVCVCMHVYMYVCMHVCIYVFIYVCKSMYVCIYVCKCMYVCMMYICLLHSINENTTKWKQWWYYKYVTEVHGTVIQ